MDTLTLLISVIAIFAIIIIVAFLVFRQRGKVEIKGPLGTQLNLNASNDLPPLSPGVKADGVVSQSGNIEIVDETGRGVDTRDIRAKKDVQISSVQSKGNTSPKE